MKKLDAFHLKMIAIVAMVINHLGYTFETQWTHPLWYFCYISIGNLTFPIMAYLLVQGFHYSRNKTKYVGRLALFWVISILPFHYLFESTSKLNPVNNIMFTLTMGLVMLILCDKYKKLDQQILFVIIFTLITLTSDWAVFGIPLIYGLYKTKRAYIPLSIIVTAMLLLLILEPISWYMKLTPISILTLIPVLSVYNGQRGYSPTWLKWGFYAFYPLHLSFLILIKFLINH